jgi:hypothetical protein
MGLDENAFLLLTLEKNRGIPFGKVLTIGRQEMHLRNYQISDLMKRMGIRKAEFLTNLDKWEKKVYCESFLKLYLDVEVVDSIDNSPYENATIIHDLNIPISEEYFEQYDTILDFGSSEHIFDIKTTVQNYQNLLSFGGRLLQILPANNHCGHGLYQFSPEFFFSLLSERNGFRNTEVFLTKSNVKRKWFKLSPPEPGSRMEFFSHKQNSAIARAEKFFNTQISMQQSDYLYNWEMGSEGTAETAPSRALRKTLIHIPVREIFNSVKSVIPQKLSMWRHFGFPLADKKLLEVYPVIKNAKLK